MCVSSRKREESSAGGAKRRKSAGGFSQRVFCLFARSAVFPVWYVATLYGRFLFFLFSFSFFLFGRSRRALVSAHELGEILGSLTKLGEKDWEEKAAEHIQPPPPDTHRHRRPSCALPVSAGVCACVCDGITFRGTGLFKFVFLRSSFPVFVLFSFLKRVGGHRLSERSLVRTRLEELLPRRGGERNRAGFPEPNQFPPGNRINDKKTKERKEGRKCVSDCASSVSMVNRAGRIIEGFDCLSVVTSAYPR